MCVIIYKPAGVKLPSLAILDQAQSLNRDGCGICSPSVTYKGLSYKSFLAHLSKCDEEEPVLIHFRMATHGSVKRSNCHPFYDAETETYFMHNGILSGITVRGDKTDSECAFRDLLLPYIKRYGLNSKKVADCANQIRGYSKFALLQGENVRLFGDFINAKGCYYSNLRFLKNRLF